MKKKAFSRAMIKGRPFQLLKASAAAKPPTPKIKGAEIQRGKTRHKRYAAPAPPITYTNCLNVRGPKILSSTSMNCGTWNCIGIAESFELLAARSSVQLINHNMQHFSDFCVQRLNFLIKEVIAECEIPGDH